ncbi:type II toxin-antitoxin system PemK/MazF family toxin [Alicyclobacillus macrosporangiidus]|uniref:type II toxin-antitoxin system PemK/MazF family toxin n=1 Tax=Alicyclobacillus macrosporangiidus TaxID=392015 RepID=UPI003CCC2CF2
MTWLTFRPDAGHEQGGRRPALVLSHGAYNNAVGLCIACPITSKVKGYPFEVSLPSGLPVYGVVLADHIKSVDWAARQSEFICECPAEVLEDVLQKLEPLIY